MSTDPVRMTTRSANAAAHPGRVVATKKRSREDGKTKKELAMERKLAKEEKQKANIRKVANFEKRLAEDDGPDITPKPQDMSKRQLKHTISYAQLPLTADNISNFDDSGSEAARKDMHDGTETENVVTEEEAPPKKKSKPGFRDAVRMYLDGDKDNTPKSKDVRQRADYVEIDDSQDDDDGLQDEVMVSQWNNFNIP